MKFWINLRNKKLQKTISQNPLNPTYKLMNKGFPPFVYGTSKIVHEFFPAGICIASNEDTETFAAVFANMDGDNIKVMGDGDKGLSKAKKQVWPSVQATRKHITPYITFMTIHIHNMDIFM